MLSCGVNEGGRSKYRGLTGQLHEDVVSEDEILRLWESDNHCMIIHGFEEPSDFYLSKSNRRYTIREVKICFLITK